MSTGLRSRAEKVAIAKLAVAVILDLADLTIGRIIGFGTALDVVLAGIGFILFGWKGFAQLWEVAEPTDQLDGFVPTLTLIGIANLRAVRRAERAG